MEPRLSIITLGVTDLDRSIAFYRDGLGLPLSRRSVPGVIAFFETGGTWLLLFGRDALAEDAGLPPSPVGAFPGFAIAHNVGSKAEVDALLAQAVAAGAKLSRAAHDAEWGGYTGYFTDPDGFPWEVAWNPHFVVS